MRSKNAQYSRCYVSRWSKHALDVCNLQRKRPEWPCGTKSIQHGAFFFFLFNVDFPLCCHINRFPLNTNTDESFIFRQWIHWVFHPLILAKSKFRWGKKKKILFFGLCLFHSVRMWNTSKWKVACATWNLSLLGVYHPLLLSTLLKTLLFFF